MMCWCRLFGWRWTRRTRSTSRIVRLAFLFLLFFFFVQRFAALIDVLPCVVLGWLSFVMRAATDVTAQYPSCGMSNATTWWLVLVIPKAIMLAFGGWLAYQVRRLNHNFNGTFLPLLYVHPLSLPTLNVWRAHCTEAKYISLALYNVIVVSTILLALIVSFPSQIATVYAVKTIGCAFCAFASMCILFLPVCHLPPSPSLYPLTFGLHFFFSFFLLCVQKFWDIYVTKDWYVLRVDGVFVRLRRLMMLTCGVRFGSRAGSITTATVMHRPSVSCGVCGCGSCVFGFV
jgi:hypothetical protein